LVTRQQFAKILAIAMDWDYPFTYQHFADVPPSSDFFIFIEAVYNRVTPEGEGVISGYTCGGAGEPCDYLNRPYFRPGANITRQQMAKMISNAGGYNQNVSSRLPTYADVPTSSPFFKYIERLTMTESNPPFPPELTQPTCPVTSPQKPCFYPGNNATRIETAHFAYMARRGPNVKAQVFPHAYNNQGVHGWDGIYAYVQTPDPGIIGDNRQWWVAAPVALGNPWGFHFVESGPEKDCITASDPSTCKRYPYASWANGGNTMGTQLTNIALDPARGYTYRTDAISPGTWQPKYCDGNGCYTILATTNQSTQDMGTNSLPFWIVGGESTDRNQHWGNIYIYNVSAHRYGGDWTTGTASCYDPKLVPIQTDYGTRSMPCTIGEWVVNY
jgi:hypothetical protein